MSHALAYVYKVEKTDKRYLLQIVLEAFNRIRDKASTYLVTSFLPPSLWCLMPVICALDLHPMHRLEV